MSVNVYDVVVAAIERDAECSRALGTGVVVLQVFSSSSSSSSVNGVSMMQMSMGMLCRGSLDSATVQVTITAGTAVPKCLSLVLQLQSTGRVIQVQLVNQ